MKWKDKLLIGGMLGLVLVGAWLMVGRPPVAVAPANSAPAGLPAEIARMLERLTPEAKEAYAYALERPDVLEHMPCYCGCGEMGHTSNLSCFVRPGAGGGVALDSHGST